MWKRTIVLITLVLIPLLSFGQEQKLPKYKVSVWEAKFDTFVDIASPNHDKYPTLKATPDIEGTLVIEFDTESLIFDFDKGLLQAVISDHYIVRIENGNMMTIPLPKFSEPTKVTYNLNGPAWNTIMVTEELDNSHVYNTWYRKIFDENRKLWHWEVAHSIRTR